MIKVAWIIIDVKIYKKEWKHMYIKDREKIEKLLTNLVKEMIRQEMIEADKKEVESNFKNAREYEIRQMLEKIEDDYSNYIRKSF